MLTSVTEFYRVLQSVTECYRVLQSVTECYRELRSVTECCRVLQSVTEYYRVLQSITNKNLVHLLGPTFGLVSLGKSGFWISVFGNRAMDYGTVQTAHCAMD